MAAPIDPRLATLEKLTSIDATLKAILLVLSEGRGAAKPAPDVDLDGPHGNPTIKAKDPRDWTGEPMKGRHFSECPADYLDMLAERFDYFATKEEDPKKAKYNRLDASRARGWAQRIRSGFVPAGVSAGDEDFASDPGWPSSDFD